MSAYLDSSALVKRYVEERGSDAVHRMFRDEDTLLVSVIAWAECLAAIARKHRAGDLSSRSRNRARDGFSAEWNGLHEVYVTKRVRDRVLDLLEERSVRGMDAIHLASALFAQEQLGEPLLFVCSDRRLEEAALGSGLEVLDPELAEER